MAGTYFVMAGTYFAYFALVIRITPKGDLIMAVVDMSTQGITWKTTVGLGAAALGVAAVVGGLKAADKGADALDLVRQADNLVVAPKGETYSLALGLMQHPGHTAERTGLLLRFADKVDDTNVRHYWQLIEDMNLPNAAVGKQLEGQLLDFMTNSKHIHLNLDGMLETLDATKLKEILKLGEQGTRVRQNITRWEFLQVWSKFRDKATFYFDGKAVDLTDLLK